MIAIKMIMTTDVIYVKATTPIYEALHLLENNQISGLPVVDDQMVVIGILSEKDVLKILIDKNLDIKNTVADYMSHKVICFKEDDSVTEVCRFFIKSHIRRVPIIRDGKLVGILSRRDLVSLILETKNQLSQFRYV